MLARIDGIPDSSELPLTYGSPVGTSTANTTESAVSMLSPNATLTASNLAVSLTVPVNLNSARTFTLEINGTDSALACFIGGLGVSCTSNAPVTVPPLSLLSIKSDSPAFFTAEATEARVSFQLSS
jgi:hypothetical protein